MFLKFILLKKRERERVPTKRNKMRWDYTAGSTQVQGFSLSGIIYNHDINLRSFFLLVEYTYVQKDFTQSFNCLPAGRANKGHKQIWKWFFTFVIVVFSDPVNSKKHFWLWREGGITTNQRRFSTHLIVTAAVFVTAPAVNVDRDVSGQLADVIFPPNWCRTSGCYPCDEFLFAWNPTLDGIGRRTCFAVTFAHRFTANQSPKWITMNNIRITTIRHCPIEFVLRKIFLINFVLFLMNSIINYC